MFKLNAEEFPPPSLMVLIKIAFWVLLNIFNLLVVEPIAVKTVSKKILSAEKDNLASESKFNSSSLLQAANKKAIKTYKRNFKRIIILAYSANATAAMLSLPISVVNNEFPHASNVAPVVITSSTNKICRFFNSSPLLI